MSDPKDKAIPEEVADAGSVEELAGDIPARGRGAPKKPAELKLTHSIRLGLTQDEYFRMVEAAAAEKLDVKEWAKNTLLVALPKENP